MPYSPEDAALLPNPQLYPYGFTGSTPNPPPTSTEPYVGIGTHSGREGSWLVPQPPPPGVAITPIQLSPSAAIQETILAQLREQGASQAALAARLSGSPGQYGPLSVVIGQGTTASNQAWPQLYRTRGDLNQFQWTQATRSAATRVRSSSRRTSRLTKFSGLGGFERQQLAEGAILAAHRAKIREG